MLFGYVWPQAANKGLEKIRVPYRFAETEYRLGLDLLGGTHLSYQADLSKLNGISADEAMQGVRDVVERRVNYFGVSEPVVQVSGDNRLNVELAGISDVNEAIALIGETPFLEFREETPETEAIIIAQQNGERLDEQPFAPTGLNGSHLERAQVVFDQQTRAAQVSLDLNDEGTKLFADLTERNLGKMIAIYLDGQIISAPVVQTAITDGNAVITGNFSPQEARLLATRLNSGALPVPITLISQQTIGASLGADSLAKSLKAGLYGMLGVALFMVIFYRLPGLLAIVALAVYVLIVLAVYKVLPVTLTLAGIAGFILSAAMAVDANVLIFSRMREELKNGKSLRRAVDEGFSRAWLSIRDSHVVTLISSVILYLFTTSIVKGFALTLGIGVIASLFTATILTQRFLMLFVGEWAEKRKWLF